MGCPIICFGSPRWRRALKIPSFFNFLRCHRDIEPDVSNGHEAVSSSKAALVEYGADIDAVVPEEGVTARELVKTNKYLEHGLKRGLLKVEPLWQRFRDALRALARSHDFFVHHSLVELIIPCIPTHELDVRRSRRRR